MKKLAFYLVLLLTGFGCTDTGECLDTGIPPERFIVAISMENPHAQDFLNEKKEKDRSVYFYKLANDNITKTPYKTLVGIGKIEDSKKEYLMIELDGNIVRNILVTGNSETIYLNNKGKSDILQIKAKRVETECDTFSKTEELIINGKKKEKLPSLHWSPIILIE